MPIDSGDRIGKLTVEECLGTRQGANRTHKVWQCRCECGGTVVRTDISLYNSRNAGSGSCPACRTFPRARKRTGSKGLNDALRDLWDSQGTLYPENYYVHTKVELMNALIQEFGALRDPTLLELGLGACPHTGEVEQTKFPSPKEFYGAYGVRPGRCMQATMSERQNCCPDCDSLNVQTVKIHNPDITDLNAEATIKCLDCKHEWEGLVTSPRTEQDQSMGWGL